MPRPCLAPYRPIFGTTEPPSGGAVCIEAGIAAGIAAVTGIAGQVILGDGTVAYKDVGRVVFATVLDYNGTPANTNDDVFISQSIESVSGPHPQLDSGFTLFCPAVIDGLT